MLSVGSARETAKDNGQYFDPSMKPFWRWRD
jgi:hypothetical protein